MSAGSAERFDVAFGLGSACSCTQTLRAAGLQFASFPFDWLLGSDLVSRTKLLLSDFEGAFEEGDFEEIANPGAFGHASYRNRKTGLSHLHDFEKGVPLAAQIAGVREKYARRCRRLTGLLAKARRALVVWLGDPRDRSPLSEADIAASLGLLRERFPETAFSFLVLDCVPGRAPADARPVVSGAVMRLAFDYRRPQAENVWEVCSEWLVPRFAAYAVTDYRTPAEKRAFARAARARDRARFPSRTFLGYLLLKFEYRVYRHLRKRLERRGLELGEVW